MDLKLMRSGCHCDRGGTEATRTVEFTKKKKVNKM